MAVNTILMLDDQLHQSKTTPVVTVSTTQAGYHKDFVRDPSWAGSWKPTDGTADEYIMADGGSAGWLGTTLNDQIIFAIAYDARGAHQTELTIATDSGDIAGGTFVQIKGVYTLNSSGPTVDYIPANNPSGGKRYWRLWAFNSARGGGTICPKIYSVAIFRPSDYFTVNASFPGEEIGRGNLGMVSKVAELPTAGGLRFRNKRGSTDQTFNLNFDHASVALWTVLRDRFYEMDNNGRQFYLQYTGLRNYAKADFQMVGVDGPAWDSIRETRDVYDTVVPIVTAPW